MAFRPQAEQRLSQANFQKLRIVGSQSAAAAIRKIVVVDHEQRPRIENQHVLDRGVWKGEYLTAVAIQIVRVGDIHEIDEFGFLHRAAVRHTLNVAAGIAAQPINVLFAENAGAEKAGAASAPTQASIMGLIIFFISISVTAIFATTIFVTTTTSYFKPAQLA